MELLPLYSASDLLHLFHLIHRVSSDETLNSALLQMRIQGIKRLFANDHNRKARQKQTLVNWALGAHSPSKISLYSTSILSPFYPFVFRKFVFRKKQNHTKNLMNEFYASIKLFLRGKKGNSLKVKTGE